jgi:hypothetical protein
VLPAHLWGTAMSTQDTRYYRERAARERAMALASERQHVREIHEELARQYDALAEQTELRSSLQTAVPDTVATRWTA